jgi:hypothetical protein
MTLLAGLAIALTGSLIACGARTADLGDGGTSSGGGGGGFPYSGPSCSATTITPACWSCLQGACPAFVGCVDNQCSAYFNCFCACPEGDEQCDQACTGSMGTACTTCVQSNETCLTTECQSQCDSTTMTGGGGSSTGSGSSGGTSVTSECTTSNMPCSNGQQVQACLNLENGACTGAYFIVGSQMVLCASCTDTTACQQGVATLCQ